MLKTILSISGKPGLYKLISQSKNMIIVESLIDGKRMPSHSHDKVVALSDIAMFTDAGEVPLHEVLAKMCAKEKVPYQYYSSMGGTDAGAFHLHAEGVLTLTHCICARSLHTAATVVDTSDIKNAKKVLIRILKTLNAHEINKFRMHRR